MAPIAAPAASTKLPPWCAQRGGMCSPEPELRRRAHSPASVELLVGNGGPAAMAALRAVIGDLGSSACGGVLTTAAASLTAPSCPPSSPSVNNAFCTGGVPGGVRKGGDRSVETVEPFAAEAVEAVGDCSVTPVRSLAFEAGVSWLCRQYCSGSFRCGVPTKKKEGAPLVAMLLDGSAHRSMGSCNWMLASGNSLRGSSQGWLSFSVRSA
mmetsp:Transcript_96251/g.206589  ORF Transcript_96251/g.206589 Transcript_96251/m.206589 type:complete len:210 (+) Transcript_96251:376-1005(+)